MLPAVPARSAGFALAVLLLACGSAVRAADGPAPGAAGNPEQSDAQRFCANVGDAARDARFAWEVRTLTDLKSEIEAKTEALEKKRAELEEWVKRRDDLLKLAEQRVVDIYAKMRPDAAASELSSTRPADRRSHRREAQSAHRKRHPRRDGHAAGRDARFFDRRHRRAGAD